MTRRSRWCGGLVACAAVMCLAPFSPAATDDDDDEDDEEHGAASAPFDQAAALAELRASIAGRETVPADSVFKNIEILKGLPAEKLLRIMEMGYARSLGANCTLCHVPGRWESDEKHEKEIARGMIRMTQEINDRLLPGIDALAEEAKEHGRKPTVNCTTCHRGSKEPALSLDSSPAAQ